MKISSTFFSASTLTAVFTVAVMTMVGGSSAKAQNLSVLLDHGGVFSAAQGGNLEVTGLLQNLSTTYALDLSSATLSLSVSPALGDPPLHDNFTFNETGTLGAGQSQSFVFLTLDTTQVAAPSAYSGSFVIEGTGTDGITPFTTNPVNPSFSLAVTPNTSPVPESSTTVSFGALLLGGAGLMLFARRRRAFGAA